MSGEEEKKKKKTPPKKTPYRIEGLFLNSLKWDSSHIRGSSY